MSSPPSPEIAALPSKEIRAMRVELNQIEQRLNEVFAIPKPLPVTKA